MAEPSILDYVKSKLMPWKYPRVEIPVGVQSPAIHAAPEQVVQMEQPPEALISPVPEEEVKPPPEPVRPPAPVPWRSLAAIVLALVAQRSFEPPDRTWQLGVALYILSFVLLVWAFWIRGITFARAF